MMRCLKLLASTIEATERLMWGYVASLAGMATTGGVLYRYRQKVISMLEGTAIERKYLELRQKCINMAVDELMHHFERKEKASHVHVGANHVKLEFDHNGESYQLFLPRIDVWPVVNVA